MATTTFSGPVVSDNGFVGVLTPPTYTVASAPTAVGNTGSIIYVSNGAAGSPVIAFSNGTNWLRCDTLAIIS
jgi:hypothetical protein